MSLAIKLSLALVCIILTLGTTSAQQTPEICSQLTYAKYQAYLWSKPYRLDRIEGQTVYAPRSQKWDVGSSGICVAVFKRGEGKPVAAVASFDGGQFKFEQLPPGEYTLVAGVNELQEIGVPIRLVEARAKAARKDITGHRLSLHLRSKGDERRSFVTVIKYPALREELLRMIEQDQAIRNEWIKAGVDTPQESIKQRIETIDKTNLARIKAIVQRYGWPVPETVGVDGAGAGFLIVQHGDHAFQKRMLPLARLAFQTGKLQGPDYALLVDRVLVGEAKPQIYGTQARVFTEWKDKQPALALIADEANVDQRRASVGLGPLADYIKGLKQQYFPH